MDPTVRGFAGIVLAMSIAWPAAALANNVGERISRQAAQIAAGTAPEQVAVFEGGRPAFRLVPNNGYVGFETTMVIEPAYIAFQDGFESREAIQQAVINWGDGTVSQAVGGEEVTHTYGYRHPRGQINPNRNQVFEGRVTFVTSTGRRYTEAFTYNMWSDRYGSLRRGAGRNMPGEILSPVDGGSNAQMPGGYVNRGRR